MLPAANTVAELMAESVSHSMPEPGSETTKVAAMVAATVAVADREAKREPEVLKVLELANIGEPVDRDQDVLDGPSAIRLLLGLLVWEMEQGRQSSGFGFWLRELGEGNGFGFRVRELGDESGLGFCVGSGKQVESGEGDGGEREEEEEEEREASHGARDGLGWGRGRRPKGGFVAIQGKERRGEHVCVRARKSMENRLVPFHVGQKQLGWDR